MRDCVTASARGTRGKEQQVDCYASRLRHRNACFAVVRFQDRVVVPASVTEERLRDVEGIYQV